MNRKERHEYKPLCKRCGSPITEIEWCNVTRYGGSPDFLPGIMECLTPDCYDANGNRQTGPANDGLTVEDIAWLNSMSAIIDE